MSTSPNANQPAVVYQTASGSKSIKAETRPRRASAEGEGLKVSTFGDHTTIPLPSTAKPVEVETRKITEKVSVMNLESGHNVLCITETKGHLKHINELIRKHNARAVIHTGDFGFHDSESWKYLNIKELKNVVQFGPFTSQMRHKLMRMSDIEMRKALEHIQLSELDLFLSGKEHFDVPVYVAWGNQEDVNVLKKFANGSYHIPNLYLLNQDSSYTIAFDGQTLRLFGVGGAFLYHRLFDIGHGTSTVSGAEGVMWATLPQLGNLIQLSERYKDPSETRILVTHVSPGKEGLVSLLATALKADFTVSGALHGKFCHAYTDFSVRTLSNYLEHISMAQSEIPRLWAHVIDAIGRDKIKDPDFSAVQTIVEAVKRCPESENDLKHIWHLNLTDVKNGYAFFQLHGVELHLGTVVCHGWTCESVQYKRRRSSVKAEHLHHPPSGKPEHHHPPAPVKEAPVAVVESHQKAPDHKDEVQESITSEKVAEPEETMTTKPNPVNEEGLFHFTVKDFGASLSEADMIRIYGFKHIKYDKITFSPEVIEMFFADETEYRRASRAVSRLMYNGTFLTVIGGNPLVDSHPTSPKTEDPLAAADDWAQVPETSSNPRKEDPLATTDGWAEQLEQQPFGERREIPN